MEELIALMQAQSRAANERLVGSIQEILVEGGDGDGRVWGRTRSHKLVHVAASCTAGSDGGAAAAPKAPQCGARHDREHASPSGGLPPWFAHPLWAASWPCTSTQPPPPLSRGIGSRTAEVPGQVVSPGVVIGILGPTGVGKTQVGIALAARLGVRVISCDSLQIYRGMPVLTNQPSATEINAVPHEMIGVAEPTEEWSAARYAQAVRPLIEADLARVGHALLVGGTGLYMRAAVGPPPPPPRPPCRPSSKPGPSATVRKPSIGNWPYWMQRRRRLSIPATSGGW